MPGPHSWRAAFPTTRLRRLRQAPWLRRLVAETTLGPQNLIWPLFVIEGEDQAVPVPSLPGVSRLTIDRAVAAARQAAALGLPAIALFPVIETDLKDAIGSQASNPDGLVARAVRAVKAAVPGLGIVCDVALDPFTSHGHDGVLDRQGRIDNDASVARLVEQALVQAAAGCDILAPSDMMDGRIAALRLALDAAGHSDTVLLSHAAKYASALYGPFRDALGSAAVLSGDKKTYQMDPANAAEALREVDLDLAEGADMVMVKPGLPYLDILRRVADSFAVPVLAYQVGGEYAMIRAAAERGWIDGERAMLECLLAFRRAGASAILTYAALDVARALAAAGGEHPRP